MSGFNLDVIWSAILEDDGNTLCLEDVVVAILP